MKHTDSNAPPKSGSNPLDCENTISIVASWQPVANIAPLKQLQYGNEICITNKKHNWEWNASLCRGITEPVSREHVTLSSAIRYSCKAHKTIDVCNNLKKCNNSSPNGYICEKPIAMHGLDSLSESHKRKNRLNSNVCTIL